MRSITCYGKKTTSYYNILNKEDAWREISEILDEEIPVLKKKIESLRGSRRREKNRMLQSKKKGRTRIYISKWFAWDALKFLDDPKEMQTTISNRLKRNNPQDLQRNSEQVIKRNTNVNRLSNQPKKKIVSPKRLASKRSRCEDPRIMEAFNILQRTVKMNKKRDECSMFGEYIAEKLRKHDNRTRMILQHQIHKLLFQAEMNMKPNPQELQSQSIQIQQPTELQNASTSCQWSSPGSDSALSRNYFSSPSPASSDTTSPQNNQTSMAS